MKKISYNFSTCGSLLGLFEKPGYLWA